ncbi:glycosyltransferase family 2 protein [Psychromarinibacter sp. S121]|uniref:glycosyltransferase family 2 protein n=1 Tax=Psychromarinibacter sp. S121 TaxID=3415127 RepID=UPI003C7E9AB8
MTSVLPLTDPAPPLTAQLSSPELAVIVPTFNEAGNVAELVSRIESALDGIAYELIFVDDNSPDGTAERIRDLSRDRPHVRCHQRIGRRGLSGAVIEGMLATTAPFAAVIDGDMQHDETRLRAMLDLLRSGAADVAVGSRYVDGGGTGNWSEDRRRASELATRLARRMTGLALSDPMSGFFMLRTDVLRARAPRLSTQGYKLLLDLLATPGEPLKVQEIPYVFRARTRGESKMDSKVLIDFLELLLAKSLGRAVPVKFILFSMVGALGVVVHMVILSLAFQGLDLGFGAAQALATFVAMTVNFFINNVFTYHDRRLRGWKLLPGWLSFCAASAVGALANVGVAVYLFDSFGAVWWASALAGIVVGAAWNYAVTALYTWKS